MYCSSWTTLSSHVHSFLNIYLYRHIYCQYHLWTASKQFILRWLVTSTGWNATTVPMVFCYILWERHPSSSELLEFTLVFTYWKWAPHLLFDMTSYSILEILHGKHTFAMLFFFFLNWSNRYTVTHGKCWKLKWSFEAICILCIATYIIHCTSFKVYSMTHFPTSATVWCEELKKKQLWRSL